jgi:hypothetical protein
MPDGNNDGSGGADDAVTAVNTPRDPTSALRPISDGECTTPPPSDSDNSGTTAGGNQVSSADAPNEPKEPTSALRPLNEPTQETNETAGHGEDA